MHTDGKDNRRGFPGLGRLRQFSGWSRSRIRALTRDPLMRDHEDTLRRLLRGNFKGLSSAERSDKVEQIIGASAMAAMAMASAPVPFLELPVQMAMVRAIAKVHGVERPGAKVLWELAGALGGGLFFRQVMRLVPIFGPLPHLSRIYGATFALGRVASVYFSREGEREPEKLRRLFSETAAESTRQQSRRLQDGELESQLRYLDDLRARSVISDEEYRRKRDQLLALT